MQTLRKKNSPCKLKNEPTRFLGDGVSFKAKLIGILEVSEARGDKMCQGALADLKMAIRAAGEHKQRITVQISIDGLRLRDEKTGDCLYHHPVHKISFIAQDMSDSRAFGYIFGSPDTGHRFFGIKTDKAASQVVIAMRDLFQVVFELKKKEIEQAKQHIEHGVIRCGTYSERSPDTKGASGTDSSLHRTGSESDRSRKRETQSGVVADLLDLQFELNSLQQGIHQMDKITPENPRAAEDPFESDPFGDSFANMKIKEKIQPILPPPPSSAKRSHIERQQTLQQTPTSGTSSPANVVSNKTPPPHGQVHWFDKETEDLFNEGELSNLARKNSSSDEDKEIQSAAASSQDRYKSIDIFSELDPLGTGIKKPYVDKKDFFQHLKNPPKKVLKDLASTNADDTFPANFTSSSDANESSDRIMTETESNKFDEGEFADFDKFKDKDISITDKTSPSIANHKESSRRTIPHQSLSVSLPPEDTSLSKSYSYSMSNSMTSNRFENKESTESIQSLVKLPSPKKYMHSSRKSEFASEYATSKSQSMDKSFPVDFSSTSESPASPLRSCSSGANSRLSSSSAEMENVPEPPPRGAGSILINPPPLPPKKHSNRVKPPPRPPHGDGHFHYDFLEREEGSPSPTRKHRGAGSPKSRNRFDDNFSPPLPQLPKRSDTSSGFSNSSFEDSFIQSPKIMNSNASSKPDVNLGKITKDITLNQLTSTFLTDLATNLGMSVSEVTSLTLQQLTECIETLARKEKEPVDETTSSETIFDTSKHNISNQSVTIEKSKVQKSSFLSEEPLFKVTFNQEPVTENRSNYDKYAVFRELLEQEQANYDTSTEKLTEDEDQIVVENQDEPGDIEDDVQSDGIDETIASLANLTVKLPPVLENQSREVSTYYEMKPSEEHSESPRNEFPSESVQQDEMESEEQYQDKDTSSTKGESFEKEKYEQPEIIDDKKDDDESEKYEDAKDTSDTFVITAEEVNELSKIVDKKPDIKSSVSTSSDKYAALREIIGEPEQPPLITESFISSPSKTVVQSSAAADLQDLFSDNFVQQTTSITASITPKKGEDVKTVVMDIFEEIKMLNSDLHRPKESKSTTSNLDSMFSIFTDTKQEKETPKEEENWAKFESDVFPEKPLGEGTSPWSPEGREFNRETQLRKSTHRHSGESDNEWKDEEGSEGSNGRSKGEGPYYSRYPRYDIPPFEDRPFYEESLEEDKSYRDKICRKTRGGPWPKTGHRSREPVTWHDDPKWEEDRRRLPHRKVPYKDEEEYRAYWKARSKQRPWNGEREGYWGPDQPYYEEECKRRLGSWGDEERESRERFSSQESMGYEEDERWYRRDYDRRRYEDENMYWRGRGPEGEYLPREVYKKPDPHYFREGRDRHYDYPPSWEEEYSGPKRADDSPRYLSRKKHWPKRPNSANDGREMIYMEGRSKCTVSRSECSDNDSDPYHRPYRSRSRDSYWGSDQEFESWGERPYWSETPDAKGESLHRKRLNRHRARPQTKSQTSPFEDDFTQSTERTEPPIDPVSTEARIRPEIEMKQPTSPRSPRSTREQSRRDPKMYKSSSYFDDDLTPTASASSDASDRQRIGSDLKVTPEELPSDVKDPVADGFASEDSGRDSFFNGDPRFDDDAFAFRSEMDDQVPEPSMPSKSSRHLKYSNSRGKSDQYIKKSESVNIFSRENDPFDDDEFFN